MNQQERITELEKALEPFAEWMRQIRQKAEGKDWPDTANVPVELDFRRMIPDLSGVTLEHLRNAEAVFSRSQALTDRMPV